MNQLAKLISALTVRQRITIVAVVVLIAGGYVYFAQWRTEKDFQPLFTGLAPDDAAAMVQKLKETGNQYRLSADGASVLAPSARVPELRLEMAAAGLPKSGRIGFELFDKQSLGTSEFIEHKNYTRALEGELERSITSITAIEMARVHLAAPKESVFVEEKEPGKASVVLRIKRGANLSRQNVTAIANFVASAVEGLSPENVTILDSHSVQLNLPRKAAGDEGSELSQQIIEYRRKVEADLLAKINATLEPLLGADKFRAGVSVDCDITSAEQSEERVDPAQSVMLTSQKTEESTGNLQNGGTPGLPSNLPRPPRQVTTASTPVNRKTENQTYKSSTIVKHTRLPQGTVKRVSVSVLFDQELKWGGTPQKPQRVLIPPSPEKVKSIHDVVAGIAGFSADRGDQIVVESLPFDATLSAPPPPYVAPPSPNGPDPRFPKWMQPLVADPKNMIIAIGAAAAVPIILFAMMFLLRKKNDKSKGKGKGKATVPDAIEPAAPHPAVPSGQTDPAIAGPAAEEQPKIEPEQEVPLFQLPKETTKKSEVIIKHIRESLPKDQDSMINVLRTWVAETSVVEKPE